ncbi:MAG: hypothetical protein AB7U85_04715 [Alphaproteobacteria bacterium]
MKKTLKILSALLFLFTSSCDGKIEENNDVFEKLGYNPRWEKIPNIAEFKEVFLKTTGQSFDDTVNDCAYKVSSKEKFIEEIKSVFFAMHYIEEVSDAEPLSRLKHIFYKSKDFCRSVIGLDLSHIKKGHKLACKRSDFFRRLVEDGSSWLLSNDYSQEVRDDWFGSQYLVPKNVKLDNIQNTIYDPYVINNELFKRNTDIIYPTKRQYAPVCKAIASSDGYMFYNQIDLKYKTTRIKKDTNIAQSQVTLDNKKLEPDYIMELDYNNDGKKELIHKIYLHENSESGCPNPDGIVYVDHCDCFYDTSDMKEGEVKPCICDLRIDRPFVAIYENNIEEVKKYLKTPNLVIKDWDQYNSIKEKFGGKNLEYECSCYVKEFAENTDFITFKGQTYILKIDKDDNLKVLHPKGKTSRYSRSCDNVCRLKSGYLQYLSDFDSSSMNLSDYIKSIIIGDKFPNLGFPIYYVNENDNLYDEGLLDEIKKISYNVAYYRPTVRKKVEEYLKQKAKTVCNVDLDKVKYQPENKAIILKLKKDETNKTVLDESKIIKNKTIAPKQKTCGLNNRNERCTLYILNNSGKDVKARYFYIPASQGTGLSQVDIAYFNDGYQDAIIKPNQFAQINIPVPFYLYYFDEATERGYIKE